MDAENCEQLLDRLGCNRIQVRGSKILSSCPFSENHWRGDKKPSFSAMIDPSGRSPYFCFSCHSKGVLENLAVKTGNSDLVPEWRTPRMDDRPWGSIPSTNAAIFRDRRKKEAVFFEDRLVAGFLGRVSGAMLRRGITKDTARAWRLGVDEKNKRSIFILKDFSGRLAVVMGRDDTGFSKAKYTNYVYDKRNDELCPFIDRNREEDFVSPTKSLFLYGEYLSQKHLEGVIERKSSDLFVVEGQMDALKMWQRGYNVVAITGSYPSDEQVDKIVALVKLGSSVNIMMDGDDAGKKCATTLSDLLRKRVPVYVLNLKDGDDPDSATDENVELAIQERKLFS